MNATEYKKSVDNYDLLADREEYNPGDKDEREWGGYEVTVLKKNGMGEDHCEKLIRVLPRNMLSLQRHRGRRETWTVKQGVLTVIVDGERRDLNAGDNIHIPKGAVHCMINVSDAPVVVHEIQEGINRENDNVRLVDFNNRPTYPLATDVERKSAALYKAIAEAIRESLNRNAA